MSTKLGFCTVRRCSYECHNSLLFSPEHHSLTIDLYRHLHWCTMECEKWCTLMHRRWKKERSRWAGIFSLVHLRCPFHLGRINVHHFRARWYTHRKRLENHDYKTVLVRNKLQSEVIIRTSSRTPKSPFYAIISLTISPNGLYICSLIFPHDITTLSG